MSNEKKNDGGQAFPYSGMERIKGPITGAESVLPVWHGGMTLRQYACIRLRVPDTGEEWLDEIIRKAQKDDFAAKAMPLIQADLHKAGLQAKPAVFAAGCYEVADAMLKAREE